MTEDKQSREAKVNDETQQQEFGTFDAVLKALMESFANVYHDKNDAIEKANALANLADRMIRIHNIEIRHEQMIQQRAMMEAQRQMKDNSGIPQNPNPPDIIVPEPRGMQ